MAKLTPTSRLQAEVPVTALLSLLWVVPIVGIVIAVDMFALNKELAHHLPGRTPSFLLYLFFAPHVYASTITFLDRGHLNTYSSKIWLVFAGILLATHMAYQFVSLAPLFVLYALLTITHFVNQQAGLSKLMMRSNPVAYLHAWRLLLITGTTMTYVAAFAETSILQISSLSVPLLVLAVLATVLCYIITQKSQTSRGKLYLWGSHFMFVGTCIYVWLGYPLLGLIGARIIHDTTAFIFYVIHDTNRNSEKTHNWVYNLLGYLKVPARWGSVVIGAALGILFYTNEHNWLFPITSIALSYFHYYTEIFMWKSDAPHRAHIAFAQ